MKTEIKPDFFLHTFSAELGGNSVILNLLSYQLQNLAFTPKTFSLRLSGNEFLWVFSLNK